MLRYFENESSLNIDLIFLLGRFESGIDTLKLDRSDVYESSRQSKLFYWRELGHADDPTWANWMDSELRTVPACLQIHRILVLDIGSVRP